MSRVVTSQKLVVCLCFGLFFSTSCSRISYTPTLVKPTLAEPVSAKVPERPMSTQSLSAYDQVSADTSAELAAENFQAIEENSSRASQRRERMPGGYWKLHGIFVGLSEPKFKSTASDTEWQEHFARLEKWKTNWPKSVAPRIALAESWVQYGVVARGKGYANQVSAENIRLYRERNQNALKELTDCEQLCKDSIEWYVAMLENGLGQGWDPVYYDKIFEAGFALEPTYYHLQSQKLLYLMPQWYGEKDDISNFIKENSQRIPGVEGDIMYFTLVSLMQEFYRGETLTKLSVSWPKIVAGYTALSKKYSMDRYRKNVFAYLAVYGGDNEVAYREMEQIGDDWDQDVWQDKSIFDQLKALFGKINTNTGNTKAQPTQPTGNNPVKNQHEPK